MKWSETFQADRAQIIDIACDQKNRDPRGRSSQLYSRETALALLNLTTNFTHIHTGGHMPNITFVLDEDLLREVKVIAARYDTSLNALVGDYLRHLASSGLVSTEEGELNGNLETLFRYSIGHLTREEARATLGTDDARLTQLLRMAGFPPPRSPKAEEDAQVEEALKFFEESENSDG
jgi:hypothetical protein